jgi:hypothetical protein
MLYDRIVGDGIAHVSDGGLVAMLVVAEFCHSLFEQTVGPDLTGEIAPAVVFVLCDDTFSVGVFDGQIVEIMPTVSFCASFRMGNEYRIAPLINLGGGLIAGGGGADVKAVGTVDF